jgi:SPP1 family predicted phage head-tail adaptor
MTFGTAAIQGIVASLLNSSVNVWRESQTPDGSGGFTVVYTDEGPAACKIDQSSAEERLLAQQAGATHTHNIYFAYDEDVQRNDRLAPSGVDPNTERPYYEVDSTHIPSSPGYLKAITEKVEGA